MPPGRPLNPSLGHGPPDPHTRGFILDPTGGEPSVPICTQSQQQKSAPAAESSLLMRRSRVAANNCLSNWSRSLSLIGQSRDDHKSGQSTHCLRCRHWLKWPHGDSLWQHLPIHNCFIIIVIIIGLNDHFNTTKKARQTIARLRQTDGQIYVVKQAFKTHQTD